MNIKQKQFIDTFLGMPLVYVNLIFAKLFGFLLHRDHSLKTPPNEIVFIKILGFGSVLMASDSIFSIRQKYPQSRISIVCSHGIRQGIESLKLFDRIYVIDDRHFSSILFSTFSILIKLWFVRNKWVVDLEVYSKLTSLLSLWTMAKNRIGFYHNNVSFRYNLNTHNVYFNTIINVEENYKRMANTLHVEVFNEYKIPGYQTSSGGPKTHIAVNNTCSDFSPERKLSPQQLIHLCNWIIENTEYRVALLGAPSDREYNEAIIKSIDDPDQVENKAGLFQFEEYYRFLAQSCLLMITIDSAPLHIANKLQLPNLSLWGPTSPESRIEANAMNRSVYLHANCSPCAHFTDKLPCNGDNFCMKNMSIELLTENLQSMLASSQTI